MKQHTSIHQTYNSAILDSQNDFAIATYGLTKIYDSYIAVNEVDLRIPRGEIYGLMGLNGAGKTSIIKMLAAAEIPTQGEIYYDGDLLNNERNNRIKQRLGYLPDNYPLYEDLTVWDYLDYFARLYQIPASHRQIRICEVLELVKLENKRNSLIPTLSRGMKQRLSLARTIIHEPIVLLLDEPVSGLDSIARTQFRSILEVLQEAGMTIVIASPILRDLTEVCTTIGVMESGFLIDTMRLDEIKCVDSFSQIVVTVLGNSAALKTELDNHLFVKKWEQIPQQNSFKINFVGSELERAKLLQYLIQKDFVITEFKLVQEDWETILLNRRNNIG